MRFRVLSLFLVFLVSACTFQMEVLTTPTPPATETASGPFQTATPFGGSEVSATPTTIKSQDLSATPAPLPTIAATNTALQAAVGNPGVFPIQFAPNGTYADVIDSILAGNSKTYSINAMKGQVASISIRQNEEAAWTALTMRIVGADNSILCASDCEFWHGILPATQEYFVTVTAAGDALDFTMRVAIDPPGTATQSFLYENKYRNASLSYTDVFAPALFPGGEASKIVPELTLRFIDTQFYTKTNLSEAYWLFGSSTDPGEVATCTEAASLNAPETVVGDVTINGVSYTKSAASGVGAGNIYETTYYRAVHNGTCYEITYYVHYGNIGNYDPNEVKEFDKAALLQEFDQILETLVLE